MESSSALRLDLPLAGMTCAACAARIEKSLNKLPGVAANVNFASGSALVTVQPDATSAAGVIEALIRLQPKTARVERDGVLVEVPVASMQIGDVFVVRAGEGNSNEGDCGAADRFEHHYLQRRPFPEHQQPE